MLWPNDVKEELSLAYVHAVASRVGFAVEQIKKDRDSIDFKILARDLLHKESTLHSPELSVQLKATARDLTEGEEISFDLPVKNYVDLSKKTMVPRILVVFFMPKDATDWVAVTNESLTMRRAAFWVSLLGAPATTNKETHRITLPAHQAFVPEGLREMLVRVSREEAL